MDDCLLSMAYFMIILEKWKVCKIKIDENSDWRWRRQSQCAYMGKGSCCLIKFYIFKAIMGQLTPML